MKKEMVEIYSEASNYAIMRPPGRRFPGSVIQGDTLYNLCTLAEFINQETERTENERLIEAAEELSEALRGRLDHYKKVLTEHNISVPFHEVQRT